MGEGAMSWDLDKEEFYQTFSELQSTEGVQRALEWAWSALEWTQEELKKEVKKSMVDGEVFNMGRSEGQADIAASLRHVLDPEDKKHWNLDGLLKEVVKLYDDFDAERKRADSLSLAYRQQQDENDTLRAQVDLLRTSLDATRDHADRVEAEMLSLRGERAAVVKWLREPGEHPDPTRIITMRADEWAKRVDADADFIESGGHRSEEEG
jgi:hypothetical protein